MKKTKPAFNSLTIHGGTVKENRRILLDDLTGRRIQYTVHPAAIESITEFKPGYHGLKFMSAHAAVYGCVARIMREWRSFITHDAILWQWEVIEDKEQ